MEAHVTSPQHEGHWKVRELAETNGIPDAAPAQQVMISVHSVDDDDNAHAGPGPVLESANHTPQPYADSSSATQEFSLWCCLFPPCYIAYKYGDYSAAFCNLLYGMFTGHIGMWAHMMLCWKPPPPPQGGPAGYPPTGPGNSSVAQSALRGNVQPFHQSGAAHATATPVGAPVAGQATAAQVSKNEYNPIWMPWTVAYNVLKAGLNNSMMYPRYFTPSWICNKKDPLVDLQVYERIVYLFFGLMVAAFIGSVMEMVGNDQVAQLEANKASSRDSDFQDAEANNEFSHYMTGIVYGIFVKNLVMNPFLSLFLVTKGRKELQKGDKCYQWCGWSAVMAFVALPIFAFFGIGGAYFYLTSDRYADFARDCVISFFSGEIFGPWTVVPYSLAKYYLGAYLRPIPYITLNNKNVRDPDDIDESEIEPFCGAHEALMCDACDCCLPAVGATQVAPTSEVSKHKTASTDVLPRAV